MNLVQDHLNAVVDAAGQPVPCVRTAPSIHRERRIDWERREFFDAVVTGTAADFWDLTLPYAQRFDREQELPIYAAVWAATKLPGATDAQRWAIVARAIREGAFKYAETKTEEARS